jgi:hypothetical protein
MNLDRIKKILESTTMDYACKRKEILVVLSEDDEIISDILEIFKIQYALNRELLLDTNLELGRAYFALNDKQKRVDKSFVIGEIKKHYQKWETYLRYYFNKKDIL